MAGAVERAVTPVPVVLRRLDEGNGRVGEVRHRGLEVGRVDDIVGIDDTHDLDVVGQVRPAPVEGARLEARPVLEMDELHAMARVAEAIALGRQGLPQVRIGGVVVEDLDDQAITRVVEPDQRPDRLDHEVRRLLVRRHLEAHHRPYRGLRGDHLDHQRTAQRIDHLEHGRCHQRQRRELDREEHETQQQPDRRVGEGHGHADQVRRVHDRADHQAAECRCARRPPLAWRGKGHHQGRPRDQRGRRGRLQLSCEPGGDRTGHHHERDPPHARGDP